MESEWEDELLDTLEQKLNRPAILANSLIILSVFFTGVACLSSGDFRIWAAWGRKKQS